MPRHPAASHGATPRSCGLYKAATTAIRMVLSGVFDKHPKLKVILGHLGETMPFLVWRVDHAIARPGAGKTISFRDIFCDNFYITTRGNFSTPALMCCVQEMGVDRILFAIDWPFVVDPPGVKWMRPCRSATRTTVVNRGLLYFSHSLLRDLGL